MNLKFKGLTFGNLIITTKKQLEDAEFTYTIKEIFELVNMLKDIQREKE